MNVVQKLVVLLLSVGAFTGAASAGSAEQSYLETCRKDPGVPVPVSVVSPAVGSEFNGATVQLEFVVDAEGKTTEFRVTSAPDDMLATEVVKAVQQWRFLPAKVEGRAVATRVALPVKIVDPALNGDRYALAR